MLNEKAKELLNQQLELLAEKSKEELLTEELAKLSIAMTKVAEVLKD